MNAVTLVRVASITVGSFGIWGALLGAQVGTTALKTLQVYPQVTASSIQHNRSIAAAFDIRVRVTNLTDADITVEKVAVLLPGEFLAGRGDANPAPQEPPPSGKLLHPGGGYSLLFTVPARRLPWLTQWMNPQLVAFVPGEYDTVVRTFFQVPPGGTESQDEVLKLSFDPPLGILIWGGIVGAVLLTAFVTAYRYMRQTNRGTLKTAGLQALWVAVGGSISAVIALILLDRLKGVELPVNITVKDFYGGIVIGLFSYKIGDWLFTNLFGPAKQPPSASVTPAVLLTSPESGKQG